MGYGPLGANVLGSYESVSTGWWRQRVLFSHFTTAGLSQALTLNSTFPSNTFPTNVWLANSGHYFDLIEVFAASLLTTATLILGVSGDTDGLVEATQVQTGQTLGLKSPGGTFDEAVGLFNAAHSPLLQMTNVGANVNTFTTGIVDVYIRYFRPYGR